jgi:hypothetical protein
MNKIFVLTALIGTLFISCSEDDDDNSQNETTCNSAAEIVTEEDFNAIVTSNYNVTDLQLNGDCLEVTINSSGCDPEPWEMNLYSVDPFDTESLLQRDVKIQLINDQLCLAVFQKTVSFDLTTFQIEGQNKVPLNIEGWNQQIIYEY